MPASRVRWLLTLYVRDLSQSDMTKTLTIVSFAGDGCGPEVKFATQLLA